MEPEPFEMGEHLVKASGKLSLLDTMLAYLQEGCVLLTLSFLPVAIILSLTGIICGFGESLIIIVTPLLLMVLINNFIIYHQFNQISTAFLTTKDFFQSLNYSKHLTSRV